MSERNEFPLSETPKNQRKGLLSISMVLFSFTFFTGKRFAGSMVGVALADVSPWMTLRVGIAAYTRLYRFFMLLAKRRAGLRGSEVLP